MSLVTGVGASQLDANFVTFFSNLTPIPAAQGHSYQCPIKGQEPLTVPPFCLESTQCGPGTPCIASPDAAPDNVCNATTNKCPYLYCGIKATPGTAQSEGAPLDTTWTVDPITGQCSTVANAVSTWCLQSSRDGTQAGCVTAGQNETCMGFWTSLEDCMAQGFSAPGSGPQPGPPHPAKCQPCPGGQNAQCCPVAAGTEGSFGSEGTCCQNCMYSFICDGTGSTTLVEGSPPNSWATSTEATCWSCNGPNCDPVAKGTKGMYTDKTCDNQCATYYQCDPKGSGQVVTTTINTGMTDPSQVKCWTCKLDSTGTKSNPTAVSATTSNPAAQGQYDSKANCRCYTCDDNGFCGPVADGGMGDNSTPACSENPCSAKQWVCDGQGNPVGKQGGVAKEDCLCWQCGGTSGTGCQPVPAGQTNGQFATQSECACINCGDKGCAYATAGAKGTFPNMTACNAQCQPTSYVCGADGSPVASWASNAVPLDQLKCWECNGTTCVPMPQGTTTSGSFNTQPACKCVVCNTNGFCQNVAQGQVGTYTDMDACNADASCSAKTWACDASGNIVPSPQGGKPKADVKCFMCDGNGKCVVSPSGDGTTNSSTCGKGCWNCYPNQDESQAIPANIDPTVVPSSNLSPCLQNGKSQCCPDASLCSGPLCSTTSTCCDNASKTPDNSACPKGQTCDSTCKCVSKTSFPSWAIGVIVGVVVIALIGMSVGIVHSVRAKKAAASQQLAQAETEVEKSYNPDNQ